MPSDDPLQPSIAFHGSSHGISHDMHNFQVFNFIALQIGNDSVALEVRFPFFVIIVKLKGDFRAASIWKLNNDPSILYLMRVPVCPVYIPVLPVSFMMASISTSSTYLNNMPPFVC